MKTMTENKKEDITRLYGYIEELDSKKEDLKRYEWAAGEGAATKVRVLKADGSVEMRPIKIGIKSEISAQVTDGLREKEQVIIGETTAKGSKTTSALSARKGP